jgi:hypothetical protein
MEGKRLRCTECDKSFVAGDGVEPGPSRRAPRGDDPRERQVTSRSGGRRRNHDDYDDLDDRPRRRKKSSGDNTAVKVIAIVGGVFAVLILACAGAWYFFIYSVAKSVDNTQDRFWQQVDKMQEEAEKQREREGFTDPPGPKDLNAALAMLEDGYGPKRRAACKWICTEPVDNARRGDVARALVRHINDRDKTVAPWALKALAVWGGKENVPAVCQVLDAHKGGGFLDDREKAAVELIGNWPTERGAESLTRLLATHEGAFLVTDTLKNMGEVALPALRKAANHRDLQIRNLARSILTQLGEKP